MSELFDYNRTQLQKIFDFHQQDRELGFNDVLKFCSSARVFPDLLTSQSIRKLFIHAAGAQLSSESSAKLMYPQFEKLLKIIAQQCFKSRKGAADEYQMLFQHIKNSCHIRYRVDLETILPIKKTSRSLIEKKIPKLNFEQFVAEQDSGIKTKHGIMFRPSTTRNSNISLFKFADSPSKNSLIGEKVKRMQELVSPRGRNQSLLKIAETREMQRSLTRPSPKPPLTDRSIKKVQSRTSSIVSSPSVSPKPTQKMRELLKKFKDDTQGILGPKKTLRIMHTTIDQMLNIREKRIMRFTQLKLSFKLWQSLTN